MFLSIEPSRWDNDMIFYWILHIIIMIFWFKFDNEKILYFSFSMFNGVNVTIERNSLEKTQFKHMFN